MKVLAVDYGSKRVGLASGDTSSKIAFPKGVVFRKSDEQVVSELMGICEKEGYARVVVGLPFDMEDEEGKDRKGLQYEHVSKFIEKLKKASSVEVIGVDERLSSFEADTYLGDFSGKKMRMEAGDRDAMAAKVILERYFGEI